MTERVAHRLPSEIEQLRFEDVVRQAAQAQGAEWAQVMGLPRTPLANGG